MVYSRVVVRYSTGPPRGPQDRGGECDSCGFHFEASLQPLEQPSEEGPKGLSRLQREKSKWEKRGDWTAGDPCLDLLASRKPSCFLHTLSLKLLQRPLLSPSKRAIERDRGEDGDEPLVDVGQV